jgi:hypothetical protein
MRVLNAWVGNNAVLLKSGNFKAGLLIVCVSAESTGKI